ncbi:hypothetical protein AAMO2058_000112400 [Amorphochlora amoebiformis]
MPKGLEIPLFNIKHTNKRGSVKNASSGTVVFDECHKLKNMLSNSNSLLPKNKNKKTSEHDIAWQEKMFGDEEYIKNIVHGNGTATGKAAYFLQHCIPNACVLYASATSLFSVRNIAPMIRHFFCSKIPMKGRMKKSNAAKLRSRIKSNIKFKVYFPHKPSGINVRPIGRRTVRLLDLLEIFQQKQVTKLTTGYKTQMHEKNDATVQHIWDRQYKQAGSQINPKRAKCAQCYECRQKNPKPGLCGGSIHLKRRIITHNLVLGNIMQIWDNISASLDNRTDGNVPKVLRCRVRGKPERGLEGGVFVGLDIESSRLDAFEHKMSTYDHVPQGPMIVARSAASLKKKLGDANLAPTLNESLRSSNKMVNKFKAMSALDIKRYLQRLQLGILFERFKDYKVTGEFLLHINHFDFQAMKVNKFASGRILFNVADSLLRASPSCQSWQAREYDGRVFYYNPSTGISTWDKPSGLQNELSQAGVSFEHVMGRRALARASGSANLRKRKQVLKTNTTHVPLASRNPNSILQPAKKKAKVEVATRVKAEVVKVG